MINTWRHVEAILILDVEDLRGGRVTRLTFGYKLLAAMTCGI